MSGRKESDIALQKEKEEKLRALHQIMETHKKLNGLSRVLKETLNNTPDGVKVTFEKETAAALSWIKTIDAIQIGKLSLDSSKDELGNVLDHLEKTYREGQEHLSAITSCYSQKFDQMEKAVYSDLIRLKGSAAGSQEILKDWFEAGDTSQIETSISKVEMLLRQKQLSQAKTQIAEIETLISSRLKEAGEMEYKHQKRLYVLKALRQVCREMGFGDSQPHFETPGKRNRIVFEVDTHQQGKIVFYVSLDGISSESEILEKRCLDEFDKLSASLEEEFGVKTKFKAQSEGPAKRLIHKGEIDMPYGVHLDKSN